VKKSYYLIGLLLLIIIAGVLFCYKQGQLKTEGSYYDNLSDFSVQDMGEKTERSPLAKAYMESITYEIIDMDKEAMNATVKVSVPQVSDALVQMVDQALADNPNESVEQIKERIMLDFQNCLETDTLPRRTQTLTVPVERTFFEYRLAPDETWYDFTIGELDELYLEYFRMMIGELTNEASDN